MFFYRQAVDEYAYNYGDQENQDIESMLRLSYLPYENLANTYSFLGMALTEGEYQPQDVSWLSNAECQRESLLMYREARQQAAMLISDPKLRRSVERRIQIGEATTSLLTGDPVLIEKAQQQIEAEVQRWNLDNETEALTLYILACWYAVADKAEVAIDGAINRARRYLAYSLGRDEQRDLWNWADQDPDLADLHPEFIERLKNQLVRVQLHQSNLYEAPGDHFRTMMDSIIEAASATHPPS